MAAGHVSENTLYKEIIEQRISWGKRTDVGQSPYKEKSFSSCCTYCSVVFFFLENLFPVKSAPREMADDKAQVNKP